MCTLISNTYFCAWCSLCFTPSTLVPTLNNHMAFLSLCLSLNVKRLFRPSCVNCSFFFLMTLPGLSVIIYLLVYFLSVFLPLECELHEWKNLVCLWILWGRESELTDCVLEMLNGKSRNPKISYIWYQGKFCSGFFFFFKYRVNQEVANTKLSKPLAFFSAVSLTSSSVMVPSSQLQPGWPFYSSSSTLQAFTLVFCSCYFFCLQFSSSR